MFPVGASRPGTMPIRFEKNIKSPREAMRGVYFSPFSPMFSRSMFLTNLRYPSRRA